jgi:hypothetical protein
VNEPLADVFSSNDDKVMTIKKDKSSQAQLCGKWSIKQSIEIHNKIRI